MSELEREREREKEREREREREREILDSPARASAIALASTQRTALTPALTSASSLLKDLHRYHGTDD